MFLPPLSLSPPPHLVLIHVFHFHLFLEFSKILFKTKNKFSSGKNNLLLIPCTVFMFLCQQCDYVLSFNLLKSHYFSPLLCSKYPQNLFKCSKFSNGSDKLPPAFLRALCTNAKSVPSENHLPFYS